MLYIKFDINNLTKFTDFQKIYKHMVYVRQPDYRYADEEPPDFDWDNMTQEEIDKGVQELINYSNPKELSFKKYLKLIPDYANNYLEAYCLNNENLEAYSKSKAVSILNYLENDFEVNFDNLEKTTSNSGIIQFSTGNYPFGGIDRFLMILKAFELTAIECFNGFSIIELKWISKFEFHSYEIPEKTKEYLKK